MTTTETIADVAVNAASPEPSTEEKLALAITELNETKDRFLLAAADLQNYRVRAQREIAAAGTRAHEAAFRAILDVADALYTALTHAPSDSSSDSSQNFIEGLRLVIRVLEKTFEQNGIKTFDSLNCTFDPKIHLAISHIHSETVLAGNIIYEFQRGYMIGDHLLRPASVSVSSGPST
jgi:molecular chaperone GrpE